MQIIDSPANHEDAASQPLTYLQPGMQVLVDGDTLVRVPDAIVARFQPGDRLLVVSPGGEVLHVPRAVHQRATEAVGHARDAFAALNRVEDSRITRFYDRFAALLDDDRVWRRIQEANDDDLRQAQARGRSTVRLIADEKMRHGMTAALRTWQQSPSLRGQVRETIRHEGLTVELVVDGFGVVGFVFEGRPNVFADATGVLRSGNTAVLRIGSDALGTARAIAAHGLTPALREADLPEHAITLLDSPEHAAGWALFSDRRLGLAVARGSGPAVATLGSIARQAGTPVSLHGTGGAWIVADRTADAGRLAAALYHSLDRKVCNTANVVLLPRARATELAVRVLETLANRGRSLGHGFKLHVAPSAEPYVPADLFATMAQIRRATGASDEPIAERLPADALGREWEWEYTPELSLAVVEDLDEGIALFNAHSPHFVASLIAEDPEVHERFFRAVDAPFVGDGFTRWVDGQYALERPELGLSNWQFGRLFGRSGVLSGDSVYTVRLRVRQHDPDLRR